MRKIIIFLLITIAANSKISDSEIANIFMLGFYGTSSNAKSIVNDICNKGLGGVILFQKSPISRGMAKNFTNAKDLKALTAELKSCGKKPLIAVDQEGGVVQRVKLKYRYPGAAKVAKMGKDKAFAIYSAMAKELHNLGINLNLAPVADLALNPKNKVIVKWGRSFGKKAEDVIKFDSIFIDAMHKYSVATSLKHFPGHGSSLGDTHKGFVDVTNLWKNIELKPYYALKDKTDSIMVAHIFNKKLDSKYPASLSRRVVSGILRGDIGFNGVVITDDLQMGAISKNYSLRDTIKLAINAGDDILLFANQVHPRRVLKVDYLVKIVRDLLNSGEIKESSIKQANIRINSLKARLQ